MFAKKGLEREFAMLNRRLHELNWEILALAYASHTADDWREIEGLRGEKEEVEEQLGVVGKLLRRKASA